MNIDPKILSTAEATALSLRELYHSYGYSLYRMSRFEPYDLYAQNRSFVAGENILTFTDTNGRLMALKPDVTLSIIKNYRSGQQKVCYRESVYRDSGSAHEFREILQTGIECIGEIGLCEQAEILTLAVESLSRISDEYLLDIASVGLINGLLRETGTDEASRNEFLKLLQEKNVFRIRSLAAQNGIRQEVVNVWERFASMYGDARMLLPELKRLCLNSEMEQGCEELADICGVLEGVDLKVDSSIVSDLGYYNGLVFKGYIPGVHSAILSGGRYDNLVRKLGKSADAIGFAVYLDRLEELDRDEQDTDADVLLCYGDKPAEEAMEKARELRAEGNSVRLQRIPDEGRYRRVIQL